MRLPKQFKHWLFLHGIKEEFKNSKYYFKDKTRRYRVSSLGTFDVSEPHETFDRWANSTKHRYPLPTNKKTLDTILEQYK